MGRRTCLTPMARLGPPIRYGPPGREVAQLYALEWLRVLRPARHLQGQIREHRKASVRAMARGIFPGCWLADVALSKLPINYLSPPVTESAAETAGAEELLRCIQEIGWRDALRPAYDLSSFQWLLSEAATAVSRGVLRTVVVREPGGSRIGWFVYYAKAGGVSVALQIGAAHRRMDKVLPALWRDAWERGSIAVRGQSISACCSTSPCGTVPSNTGATASCCIAATRNWWHVCCRARPRSRGWTASGG